MNATITGTTAIEHEAIAAARDNAEGAARIATETEDEQGWQAAASWRGKVEGAAQTLALLFGASAAHTEASLYEAAEESHRRSAQLWSESDRTEWAAKAERAAEVAARRAFLATKV